MFSLFADPSDTFWILCPETGMALCLRILKIPYIWYCSYSKQMGIGIRKPWVQIPDVHL